MATIAVGRRNAERRFYTGMAIMMIVLVLIGFAPSFYFRGLVHYPRPNPVISPFVLFHGLVFSAWMLLFLAQTQLIAGGRRAVHMALGGVGMVFAAALVPVMYLTAVGQVARANQPPGTTPLGWTAMGLFPIPLFVLLVWLGWRHRRDAQAHKRLMLCAALMMTDPAIGRFPIAPPTPLGQGLLALLTLATFIPLMLWDRRTLGRLHWATKLGFAGFGLLMAVRLYAVYSPAWAAFAAHLPGV